MHPQKANVTERREFDSGSSYKHVRAAAAAQSWSKWHFITRSPDTVIDEISETSVLDSFKLASRRDL